MASIRLATESDAAAVADIYRPIVTSTAITFETEPPSVDEMRRRIVETLPVYPWLICDVEGGVAGYAYATKHRVRAAYRWSVDTSIYVDPKARRTGIGRGLYRSLFAILAAQGYFNAYAGIALPNPGSVALHEAMGFQSIGVFRKVGFKRGAWHDVGWWELTLKSTGEDVPREPLPMAVVQSRVDWTARLSSGARDIRHGRA